MKWSTIKTLALIGLAALILWYLGTSMDLLAGLGLGGWLERERNRSGDGSANDDVPDREPVEEEEPTHEVAGSVQAAEADVRASSDGGKGSLSDDVASLADELRKQRKEDS